MTLPSSCRSSPAMARKSVVLPQPDGPRKQTNSPRLTSRSMSFRAVKVPKRFDKPSMRRNGCAISLMLSPTPSFRSEGRVILGPRSGPEDLVTLRAILAPRSSGLRFAPPEDDARRIAPE